MGEIDVCNDKELDNLTISEGQIEIINMVF